MKYTQKRYWQVGLLILLLVLPACSPQKDHLVLSLDGVEVSVDRKMYNAIQKEINADSDDKETQLLEYLFYWQGAHVVESVTVITEDDSATYDWQDIAEDTLWCDVNCVVIEGVKYLPERLEVTTGGFEAEMVYSITDISRITAEALGLDFLEDSRLSLPDGDFSHVAWFFLDGFGYEQFQVAKEEGLTPYLESTGTLYPAYGIYPPRTTTSTAALLSGVDSSQNGVFRSGIRSLTIPSILDAVVDAGMQFDVVEGYSTPFNYPGAGITLSGDRDGNGATDDEVFNNAKEVIADGIHEALMVHFHGIDDVGHTYGPYSAEWYEKVAEVDTYISELVPMLPDGTLVIIFPDHGMHPITDDVSIGNHGNLFFEDMGIYMILHTK